MSFRHGKDAEVWLGAADVSSYFRNAEFGGEADTAETTTFKKSWKTHLPGASSATASLEGLYDPALTNPRDSLGLAAGSILTIGPAGLETVGDDARLLVARATAYAESSPIGDIVVFNYSILADGPVGFGEVLHPLAERTTDANGTAHTGPVGGTTTGAIAHLHVTSVSASDTLDVHIEDSANGVDWLDLSGAVFTQASAVGAERITISGTVRRYLRAVWDITGTDPAITFSVAIART